MSYPVKIETLVDLVRKGEEAKVIEILKDLDVAEESNLGPKVVWTGSRDGIDDAE